tara:strand:- start:135 stop:341 length:207 start_codon:yes stop_codon:yes gene_type:complete
MKGLLRHGAVLQLLALNLLRPNVHYVVVVVVKSQVQQKVIACDDTMLVGEPKLMYDGDVELGRRDHRR